MVTRRSRDTISRVMLSVSEHDGAEITLRQTQGDNGAA
jgi:hypothetical protein